ncbi:FUSC family protein [Parasaccharibacter sp. TMW2.1882]|uniref:FUSC family protein n=2 Tax=Acetobacteraceae TaxID=433 RepID=A0A7U7G5V1_9PROT|nr:MULTISPECIES: FUSC family protein [Acetobacteraceae]MCL1562876.1 FUSC family protein [Parasaccharibacter sp. TMW 2.1886]MCQ0041068.1 FUSC family protein [Bombella sp.]MUG79619.1 FUSC family protein [Bombella sp. ESL0380]QGT75254.1 FUSC family protein [Bombella sp. ESL0368]MBE1723481.1 FUSC family protein [Bombella apis]
MITRFLNFRTPSFFYWIFTPSLDGFLFALRTTIAACLSLGIALWLELDSPIWAPMTVWSVAQLTRGESLSKARWRIIGTLAGGVAALIFVGIYPQAPWLFFPIIALWIGLCSGLATFVSNFRSYALVLSGYTCAIICMDVVPHTGSIFMFAVSRASYIILGVLCEAFIGLLFAFNQDRVAHLKIRQKLESALTLVADTLHHILQRDTGALTEARKLFGTILSINDQIEFAELEMGAHGHEGDHARAALAAVSALLSRSFGMATRLELLSSNHQDFDTVARAFRHFLKDFSSRLPQEAEISELLAELQHLRDICRRYATPHRQKIISTSGPLTPLRDKTTIITDSALDERILFSSLGDLIGDLEEAITEYHASTHSVRGDHFQFQRHTHRDGRLAFNNGFRAALTILVTSFIYEITAWSNGNTLISITALICGLFATKEDPVLGTIKFLKGLAVGWCVAWLLCFIFIPMVTTYEPLVLILSCVMMIGGLARANPATAPAASAFNLLMPLMLGIQNHHVIDETKFYNTNLAIILAGVTAVLIFRSILPFNRKAEEFRLRRATLRELRNLASLSSTPQISAWIGHSTDRFSRLLSHATTLSPLVEAGIQGTLATLTLGLNIIRLRGLLNREYLPESARRPITLVLYYIEHSSRRHDRAARLTRAAIRRLRELDTQDHEAIIRLEITRALAHLVVIEHTLRTNENFLDASKPFRGEGPIPLPHDEDSYAGHPQRA